MTRTLLWAGLALVLVGCRGTHIKPLVSQTYPAHDQKVCVLPHGLPPSVAHIEVASVKVELNSYGGDRRAKAGLAKAARSLGAHAVVKASFGNLMGAPEGDGVAVVLTAPSQQLPAECEWY